MKDGVKIVNCARGGIVDEGALYDAIKAGKVSGAALDVFEKEPPGDSPLMSLDEVICTPHLGASTLEAQENVALAVADQVADYLISGTIRNAVNFPSIPADQVNTLKPYIDLAEKMGRFAFFFMDETVKEIDVELRGKASEIMSEPVEIAAVKGFLTPVLEHTVNFVNASHIAKERGIVVKVTKNADAGDYYTRIDLTIKASTRSFSVSGTLFSKKDPRIIKINNLMIEVIPERTMLYIDNNDKPGVIGSIGTLFGEAGINIARMHFGRETKGGMAVSVVSVDGSIGQDILDKIKKLPNIIEVKKITMNG
jgi:D-3-phosphoglycerate dehydrogenase